MNAFCVFKLRCIIFKFNKSRWGWIELTWFLRSSTSQTFPTKNPRRPTTLFLFAHSSICYRWQWWSVVCINFVDFRMLMFLKVVYKLSVPISTVKKSSNEISNITGIAKMYKSYLEIYSALIFCKKLLRFRWKLRNSSNAE